MQYIYTYEGRNLAAGDEVAGYKIEMFTDELVKATTDFPREWWYSGFHSRWTLCSRLGIKAIPIPESGIFNRITGERIHAPTYESPIVVLPDGSALDMFDEHSRSVYIQIRQGGRCTTNNSASFLTELGIEVRVGLTADIVNQVPRFLRKGVVCIKVGRSFVPAEEAVWSQVDKKYIRLADAVEAGSFWGHRDSNKLIQFVDGGYGIRGSGYEITGGPHAGKFVRRRSDRRAVGGLYYPTEDLVPVYGYSSTPDLYLLDPPVSSPEFEFINDCWCFAGLSVILTNGERRARHLSVSVAIGVDERGGRIYGIVDREDPSIGQCEKCGGWYTEELLRGDTCVICLGASRTKVRGYSNSSANRLVPEMDVPIKFGIELEVGTDKGYSTEDCAATMADALSERQDFVEYGVFKHDGSIECGGFEIVTRPDAPEVHKRIWTKALSTPDVQKKMSSWTNKYCGMHIHVSREPLSALWIGRILVVVNSPDMSELVTAVAGRGSMRYAQRMDKRLTSGKSRYGDRYEAVNTTGSNTIEFRIFRGTLALNGFLRNIEFVEAVLAYTRPAETGLTSIGKLGSFLNFIEKSRKSYPALFAFLVKEGFIPDPRKPKAGLSDQLTLCA